MIDFGISKIALVGPLPPPQGGMANQTKQLARLLEGEGAGVNVVRTNAPYQPRLIEGVRGVRALFRFVPYLRTLHRAARDAIVIEAPAPREPVPEATPEAAPAPAPAARDGQRIKASPLARKMAAQAGIDLGALTGSGPKGPWPPI